MLKATLLLPIDQRLRLVLYGVTITLNAPLNVQEVTRLYANAASGNQTAQGYRFLDTPTAKVSGQVDEYEPESVWLTVESKQLDQLTRERLVEFAMNPAFHEA